MRQSSRTASPPLKMGSSTRRPYQKENLVSSQSIPTNVCPVGSVGYGNTSASAAFEQGVGISSMARASA